MSAESANKDRIDTIFRMIEADRALRAESNTLTQVELAQIAMKLEQLEKDSRANKESDDAMNKEVLDKLNAIQSAPAPAPAATESAGIGSLIKEWKIILVLIGGMTGLNQGVDAAKTQFWPGPMPAQTRVEYIQQPAQPQHSHHGQTHPHSGKRAPKVDGY